MGENLRWRPRGSIVVIALAVIAALAIASPVLGIAGSLKKAIKKEVSKQLASKQAPSGPPGPAGPAGSARAYGLVASNGTISRSKGIVGDATGPTGTGNYCITLADSIDASTVVVLVATDYSNDLTGQTAANETVAEWVSTPGCPGGNDIMVKTFLYDGDSDDDNDGLGDAVGDHLDPANAGFSFMVP